MYNFLQHLLANETILYQGRPTTGKGGKSLGGYFFLIGFTLVVALIMILSVITGTGDDENGITITFLIIFTTNIFFLAIGVHGLIYELFLKKKQVANDFYCLTNLRAMKYEEKKNKLVFGYLANFDSISCDNIKDNFGDLCMTIGTNEEAENNPNFTLEQINEMFTNPNPENMPSIEFSSIESPEKVMNLAIMARQNNLQSKNQQSPSPVNINTQQL